MAFAARPPTAAITLPLAPTLSPLLAASDDPADIRAALARVSSLRFRHLQLSATQAGLRPRDLDRSARRDLLATLRRHELELSGLDCWIPASHFNDPNHQNRAVDAVRAAIELAADLGRVPISVALPADIADQPLPTWRSDLAAHAGRFGIAVADHAVPPSARDGGGGAAEIGIDPAALLSHSLDPAAMVHQNANRLAAARLSDLDQTGLRCPLGANADGRLDVLAYRVALTLAEFNRPVILDARQWIDPWKGLAISQERWTSIA